MSSLLGGGRCDVLFVWKGGVRCHVCLDGGR